MIPDYHFRAEHANPRTTRLFHLLFYLGAALLLVAAGQSLYFYFTDWSASDDGHFWYLILGLLYLLVSGLIAWFTYHHGDGQETPPDRYVEIRDGIMVWELDQLNGKQRVDLDTVVRADRPSVRDFLLTLQDGTQIVLPIFLVDEEAKQVELENILLAIGQA